MSAGSAGPLPARGAWGIWLDLARAGNLPSVWSNVLAAWVLSAPVTGTWPPAVALGLTLLAGSLAYAGGTTLNDVADAVFDARHRPERAIPQGWIRRSTAAWLGGGQLAAGLAILWLLGAAPAAVLGLGAVIGLYDVLHKRWAGSVLLMAGCRVLLAVCVATLPGQRMTPVFLAWAGVLFAYIVVLSLLARREYQPGAPAERLSHIVRQLLAFIPFVDAIALLLVMASIPAGLCMLAVPLGRWAQRRAAST